MLTLEIISLCKQYDAHKADWIKDRWKHYTTRDINLPIKAFFIVTQTWWSARKFLHWCSQTTSYSKYLYIDTFLPLTTFFHRLFSMWATTFPSWRIIFKHRKYSNTQTTQLKRDFIFHISTGPVLLDVLR